MTADWRAIMLQLPGRKPDVSLRLPKPPSINKAYANVAGVGRVKTAEHKQWRKRAKSELWGQRWPETITGPVAIVFEVPKVAARQDCANYEKAVSDFLVDIGVIKDDSLIWFNCQTWANKAEMTVSIFLL